MARPRIFISSTFYDLKQVRASLEAFVRDLGYEPIVADNITYLPDQALDESCYAEAQTCDIFVLIVGGRYGSEVSGEAQHTEKDFYDRYKSITRQEFESALDRDVPIYVLIDRAVQVDYETYRLNRDNETIRYAHVSSVGVFDLIDYIRTQTQKPVHEFERSADIQGWLREQWSGLFKRMLSERSESKRLTTLESQVNELENLNKTLKRYLEELVGQKSEGKQIIEEEESRLRKERIGNLPHFKFLAAKLSEEEIEDLVTNAENFESYVQALRQKYVEAGGVIGTAEEEIEELRSSRVRQWQIQQLRQHFGKQPLGWLSTGDGRKPVAD